MTENMVPRITAMKAPGDNLDIGIPAEVTEMIVESAEHKGRKYHLPNSAQLYLVYIGLEAFHGMLHKQIVTMIQTRFYSQKKIIT